MSRGPKEVPTANDEDIVGEFFTIKFCDGALQSFIDCLVSTKKKQSDRLKVDMNELLKRLADGKALSAGSDVLEGKLPDNTKFRCLKKIPIRAYYWKSKRYSGCIFVSHFIYKNQQKLQQSDIDRVCSNWCKIET